nr:MAG TPA: hypothetical protein [Caudoviricetes sp.]
MAKKKQTEEAVPVVEPGNEQEVETQKENAEVVETEAKPDAPEIVDSAQENKLENEGDNLEKENEGVETAAKSQEDVIPALALGYLKRHAEVKEVYIDKLGGVFSANTPKVFLKDAVLYQNPFYKQ